MGKMQYEDEQRPHILPDRMRYTEATEPAVAPGAFFSKIVSTEFVGMLTQVAVGIVMMMVSLGVINAADSEDIAKTISGIVGAAFALLTNLAAVWKYNSGRTELKKESLRTNVDRIMAERALPAEVQISKTTATETKE